MPSLELSPAIDKLPILPHDSVLLPVVRTTLCHVIPGAWQEPTLMNQPVLQLAHVSRWCEEQLAPVTAIPLEQVQTLTWQVDPLREYPL
jgi:hypothetical protein